MNDLVFIDNKYCRWYFQIINRARARSPGNRMELHHVIPKSIGGSNSAGNMAALTYREHFLAHWLLTKFTTGEFKTKMLRALACMAMTQRGGILSARQFAVARAAARQVHKGKQYALGLKRSEETRKRMSEAARNRSAETLQKMSRAAKNRTPEVKEKFRIAAANISEETRKKRSAAAYLRRHTNETKKKISLAAIGHKRCVGRRLSAETKAKIGAASRERWARKLQQGS